MNGKLRLRFPFLGGLSPDSKSALTFMAPSLILLGVLGILPILGVLWVSLWRYLPIFHQLEFVGLRNYLLLINDSRFWHACTTTLYFTLISVGAEVGLGLGIAMVLHRLMQGQAGRATEPGGSTMAWLQAGLLIPWAVPTVVSARMWEWIYQTDAGLLNYALITCGLIRQPIAWLSDPTWALHGAILMDIWKTTPFAALLLLAGLMAIPQEIWQAAQIDGAGGWTMLRRVTLPLLAPVIMIVLVFRTMDAIRVFDSIYVLTGGGPGNGTETLSIYAYKTLFQTLQFGYGSAMAVLMFVIALLITGAYGFLLRRQTGRSG